MSIFTSEVCNIFRTIVIGGAITATALPIGSLAESAASFVAVSYTHLTLPTNREV